jgi:hypothetical protein
MTTKTCLNCGRTVNDAFCAGCGQKTDTHRISFMNFISHDLLHGAFHIEKGMLFTTRQALLRPGKAALDYIAGKRKPYYNVFLLVLFTLGVILFLHHFYEVLAVRQGDAFAKPVYPNEASEKIDRIFAEKSKWIIFLFVPLAALNSFLLFRRKKLNLSEHAIIAGMILLGMLLISALGNLLFYLNLFSDTDVFAPFIDFGTPALVILYILYAYTNAFGSEYRPWGMGLRLILFFALLALEIWLLLLLLIGYATDWKFGPVTLSPF